MSNAPPRRDVVQPTTRLSAVLCAGLARFGSPNPAPTATFFVPDDDESSGDRDVVVTLLLKCDAENGSAEDIVIDNNVIQDAKNGKEPDVRLVKPGHIVFELFRGMGNSRALRHTFVGDKSSVSENGKVMFDNLQLERLALFRDGGTTLERLQVAHPTKPKWLTPDLRPGPSVTTLKLFFRGP